MINFEHFHDDKTWRVSTHGQQMGKRYTYIGRWPSQLQPVWPDKNRQMSVKVAQKWYILIPLQKLPKNVRDWKSSPKCKKSPNLVTDYNL